MWGYTFGAALFVLLHSTVDAKRIYHIPFDFQRNEAYDPYLKLCVIDGQQIPVGHRFLTPSNVCVCWYSGAVCHKKRLVCEHEGKIHQVGESFEKQRFNCFCYLDGLFCKPKPGYRPNDLAEYKKYEECGIENLDTGGRVVGGEEAPPHRYPWLVFMKFQYLASDGSGYYFKCTGSLINEQWVLTAAHCMVPDKVIKSVPHRLYQVQVFLGAHNTEKSGIKYTSPAAYIISHPKYDKVTKQHDIGLIRLTSRARYSQKVRPICMPTGLYGRSAKNTGGMRVTIAGWGRIDQNKKTNVLYHASMNSIPTEMCSKFYVEEITNNMFCSSSDEARQCKGDSGGPIFYNENGRMVQVAVVSFSKKVRQLCLLGIPAVQTYLPNYMDWIHEVMNTNN